jgi:aminomethyltransferase
MKPVKHTPLNAAHRALGARMTGFGGFEMPLSYSGIIEEHLAVRSAAGIFDLSHMGEFAIAGPEALGLLEHALTNSAARLVDGQAQYTLMCAEDGGTIDDLIVYRLAAERYMLCVNASNIAADREWLLELARGRTEFRDISDETALIAVQGPKSREILGGLAKIAIESIGRFRTAEGEVAGVRSLIARTGYTGEDGYEIILPEGAAVGLWNRLIAAGVAPAGLGARDTLRLEAGMNLYGQDMDESVTPWEAGLAWTVALDEGRGFIGRAALEQQKAAGSGRVMVGLVMDDKGVLRHGQRVVTAHGDGEILSGTFSPTLGKAIAFARLPGGAAADRIEVDIRGRLVPVRVARYPFVRDGKACVS